MLYYDELKEAIDRGFIKGDTVQIVRKNGIVFDYVLPNEPVKTDEVVTIEKVADVLEELKNGNTKTARTFSLYHKSTRLGAFFLPAELVKLL